LLDVTNRDGVQASRIGLAKLQKTILNLHLDKFGVFQSEAGFPNLKHEANYLNTNVELAQKGVIARMRVSGWCRAVPVDIEDSWRMTQVRHFNISISTSDQMIIHKFQGKLDRESVVKEMVETLELAREKGAESVGVNSEDASRTDLKYLLRFASEAKEHGACRFRYCDTLGYEYVDNMYTRAKTLAQEVGLPIEAHCHNDLGMVVANSVACALGAVAGGVDAYINTTVNGVGERAGNCDLVSVVLALKYASSLTERNLLDPNVNLHHAWKMAKYTGYAFGIPIPINQPGVGANMFAHESGIHADGALKDRRNYELYDFEELGRGEPETVPTGRVITTGEYGGIKGFRQVYSDLGVEFESDKQAREILELVQYANLHTCKPLHEDELRFIAEYPEETRKILTVAP
jgi:homocitrate synthase NifV